ncbi:DMT family transporter [Paenibacillus nasutitermitis]|uniref:Quaternary ammonium compound-resistance protein SugE n=1 Tax=Paenibacillus nasutitermitis TaxID=1652958 RepID=A0A916ZGG4_9BACL|nr:SMR family transporter [Paenibacillus nasutitermitis]GGD94105.1 quaternary ammonium compound-resistance protein SugE [Paenibacillus nasutitermitis]
MSASNKAWLMVVCGGLLEIVWAAGFKYEQVPALVVLIALLTSFDLIIRAVKVIPVGTAYAVFAAMGTIGTLLVDTIASGGNISLLKVVIILCLLLFTVGLKFTSGGGKK